MHKVTVTGIRSSVHCKKTVDFSNLQISTMVMQACSQVFSIGDESR